MPTSTTSRVPSDDREAIRLVSQALTLSATWLALHRDELPTQLTGRLIGQREVAVQGLLERVATETDWLWLKPMRQALTAAGGDEVRPFVGHSHRVNQVAVTQGGRQIVSAAYDGTVRVWSMTKAQECLVLSAAGSGTPVCFAVALDGTGIVTTLPDHSVVLQRLDGNQSPVQLGSLAERILDIGLSSDGAKAIVVFGDPNWSTRLALLDLSGRAPPTPLQLTGLPRWTRHRLKIRGARFCNEDRSIVTWGGSTQLLVWDVTRQEQPRALKGHTREVRHVAIAPDGEHVVSASRDRTLRIWSVTGLAPPAVLRGHTAAVNYVAVTPDGQHVVSASQDKTLRVWRTGKDAAERVLRGHLAEISFVAVTPDGTRAVSASRDMTLRVWDLFGNAPPTVYKGHTDEISQVALTRDSRFAVSASHDRTLRCWRLDGGDASASAVQHKTAVTHVAVSSDGGRMMTAARGDRNLLLWAPARLEEPLSLKGHKQRITDVVVAPDGGFAVSASADGTLTVWDMNRRNQRWPRKSGHSAKWTLCDFNAGAEPERAG